MKRRIVVLLLLAAIVLLAINSTRVERAFAIRSLRNRGFTVGLKIYKDTGANGLLNLRPRRAAVVRFLFPDLLWAPVEHVGLYRGEISDSDLDQIVTLEQIDRIGLRECGLHDDDLAKLVTLRGVRSLDLAENNLTDASVPYLKAFNQLEDLDLSGNGLSADDKIKDLLNLRSYRNDDGT